MCGRTYPLHPQGGIPVLISERSPLNVAEILAARIEPQTVDLAVAQKHWQTGKLTDLLASTQGKTLLNFGSGDGGDRRWLEGKGYDVVTFDVYPGDFTDFICDGHELPFADDSFDTVTSTAVFEHLYNPFQAAREIHRVLKKGGALVGSSAFLEPFHAESYFHMSHRGLTEVFTRAGFRNVQVYPGWSFLESLNGNFWIWNRLRPLRKLSGLVNRLKFAWGKKLWQVAYAVKGKPMSERLRLGFSGSLIFKAVK
jgi:SAM-dependent methyltransferase